MKEINHLEPLEYVSGPNTTATQKELAINEKNVKAFIKTINNVLTHSRNNMQQTPANIALIDSKIKAAVEPLVSIVTAGIDLNIFPEDAYKVLSAKMRNFGSDNTRVNNIISGVLAAHKAKSTIQTDDAFSQPEIAAIIAEPSTDEPDELLVTTNDGGLMGFNKRLGILTAYIRDKNGRIIDKLERVIEGNGSWRERAVAFLKRVFYIVVNAVTIGSLYVLSATTGFLSGFFGNTYKPKQAVVLADVTALEAPAAA